MSIRELKVRRSQAARKLAGVRIRWPDSPNVAWRMGKSGLPNNPVR